MKQFFQRLGLRTRVVLTVLAASIGLVMAASPAQAAGTYLYRNDGGTIWATQSIGASSGTLVRSGRSYTMYCWQDGPWTNFHGNYWTNRYFWGRVYTPSGDFNAWVTASVVANQTSVGHC